MITEKLVKNLKSKRRLIKEEKNKLSQAKDLEEKTIEACADKICEVEQEKGNSKGKKIVIVGTMLATLGVALASAMIDIVNDNMKKDIKSNQDLIQVAEPKEIDERTETNSSGGCVIRTKEQAEPGKEAKGTVINSNRNYVIRPEESKDPNIEIVGDLHEYQKHKADGKVITDPKELDRFLDEADIDWVR